MASARPSIPVGVLQQKGRFLLLAEPILKDSNDLLRGLSIKAGIGIYKFHNTSKGPYPDPIDIVLNGVSVPSAGRHPDPYMDRYPARIWINSMDAGLIPLLRIR